MAIPRLMLKTDVSGLHAVTYNGQPVSAHFQTLVTAVRSRMRGAAPPLFAESVESGTNRSWYGEGTGDPVAFPDLPATSKVAAESRLRRALELLDPLLDDRDMGPLIRRALVVPSLSSVLALDDSVVLTDWGFAPAEVGDDAAALARHISAIYGPYSPRLATTTADFFGPVTAAPAGSAVAAGAPVAATYAAAAASAATAGRGAAPAPAAPRSGSTVVMAPAQRGRNLWMVPTFAAVAAIFLLLGFWLAWTHLVKDLAGRQFQTPLGDEKATRIAIQTQRDTNNALERELANARRALENSNVCSPDFPNGAVPAAPERQPIQPGTAPPPAPERKGEAPTPYKGGSLADLLEHATVWIVVQTPNGIGSGTGFFITTDTILTNAHVVQASSGPQVYVTSKSIGRVLPGKVMSLTHGEGGGAVGVGQADFALIHLSDIVPGIQPLAFGLRAEKLADVVAAGYPAAIIKQEEAVQELRQGRLASAPELVLTRGSISSMQQLPNGINIMPHSADISAGNSGGPLVDLCGYVVGINTFVTASERFVDRTKYALRSDSILPWLGQQNVAVQKHDELCHPAPPTAIAPPVVAAAPGAPSSAPASPGSSAPTRPSTGAPAQGAPQVPAAAK